MPKPKGAISKDRPINADNLRDFLKLIHQKLKDKGVADNDLPNNEDLVQRLPQFVDEKAIEKWVASYAEWVSRKP